MLFRSATAAYTYRADITASNWVVAGAVTILSIDGLEFDPHNNGAALVVILDDGSMVDLQILDGSDLAYLPWGAQTTPVNFLPFAPSADARTGTVFLIVTDIKMMVRYHDGIAVGFCLGVNSCA